MVELSDKVFTLPIRVRFSDLDALGHVNHAVFLSYFEDCRINWFESLNLVKDKRGIVPLILAKIDVDYHLPILLKDKVESRCWLSHLGEKSFHISYELIGKESNKTHAVGKTVIVWFDYGTGKSTSIPETAREKLKSQL